MSANRVQYLCNECNVAQNIVFSPKMKKEYIPKDLSGLALYSDIHICTMGILGVNNLYIDHNLHVRSYSYVKLPDYKAKKSNGIPMPGKSSEDSHDLTEIIITQIFEKNDINITIYNAYSETLLNLGNVDYNKQAPVKTLTSAMGIVNLKFYYSKTRYTSQLEKWLELFVNIYESLPPSRFGVIVEVLRFLLDEKDNFPSEFDEMIMKTILASHEIYFELVEGAHDGDFLDNVYGEGEGKVMKLILELIEENPMLPLHDYSLTLKEEIVFVIYCFLLLEKHGLIIIYRPGIITSE